jgi:3-deoxy-D-manno-octulosonic-acid transferase
MILIYRALINIVLLLSPLIILFRIINKKEDKKRFREKLGFFSQKRNKGNLIWFHGASVGELQSIVPILEKFQKDKKINHILVTSNTLSSSKIISKPHLKKVIHQFFPIDVNIISKKFIDYWKPSRVFFIDSEIWPNTLNNLKNKKIPITLLNARITHRTYKKWNLFPKFAHENFRKFDLCLTSSLESQKYLKNLKAPNVKYIGNLKFAQSENENLIKLKGLKKITKIKKIWCASSTHDNEELFFAQVHLELRKKINNLFTIIIPRHVNRSDKIKDELSNLGLKVQMYEPKKEINLDTDIYIVNSYGMTKSFYSNCKIVFLGGSIIKHGGQNPLEAIRYNCKVLHGPNVSNFKEIYKFLNEKKMSSKIINQKQLINILQNFFLKKNKLKNFRKEIKLIGTQILNKTYRAITQ